MWHKIWIILRSEYWRRVRTKAFILTTLLLPFGLILLMVAPGAIGYFASQSSTTRIAVIDETDVLFDRMQEASGSPFVLSPTDLPRDSVEAAVRAGTYDGYLVLPKNLLDGGSEATYTSSQGGGLTTRAQLDDLIDEAVQDERLARENAPPEVLSILESNVSLTTRQLTEEGATDDSSIAYMAVGWAMAFLIYMAVLIYGQYVMQGVIEEKNSRVVEIVVSSVRPFELMMGKVLGIGAMGLTQFIVWGVLILGGTSMLGSVAALFLTPSMLNLPDGASEDAVHQAVDVSLPSLSPGLLIWFVLFFLGGYLLYASLFAAVGSAVEQQQDAQSFVVPLTLPLIIPIVTLFFMLEAPNAPFSVVMSMIPFFSPVLMVARLAVASVPFWQVGGAFLLLAGTFVGAIWMSGRIYRVGILMYGKKPSLREVARWLTY
jgi:ABC-2 type transport system permease protein